jgi:hypothetical protein
MFKTIAQWLRRGVARTLAVLGLPLVADQTNYFDSEKSVFKVNDGSSLRDLSPYVKELRGLPGQFKVNDITTFGSVGERPGPSIYVNHFTVEFLFNMVTSVGVHTVLATMHSAKALRAFEFYPAGSGTTGNAKFSGSAYCPVYEIVSRVGDYVQVHAEFHVDNGVTIGTA